ncbi:MAG: hypothetical protein AAF772_10310 [Acidobacteriota bacterium]
MVYAVLFYLALCALVGLLGYGRRSGFWGAFLLSVVFTPLVVALIIALTERLPSARPSTNDASTDGAPRDTTTASTS